MDALPIALIAAGVIVVLVVVDDSTLGLIRGLWNQIVGPRPPPSTLPPPPAVDVATFRVVALGLQAAGKTVLLASMYHELGPQPDERQWFLRGTFEQNKHLAELHRRLRDTSMGWPPGTLPADSREFLFACRAFSRASDEHTVFRISYLDYSGEGVGPGNYLPSLSVWLEERAKAAHAILVMVDGERVWQLLNSPANAPPQDTHYYFGNDMSPLLGLAQEATCPVQLVITKWDRLCPSAATPEQEDEMLWRIRRRLMSYGSIRQLVDAHCDRGETVRLIPLSAVGPEFADLRPDGPPGKRPDGQLHPINVDVPLCAVISDVLDRMEGSLTPALRRQLDAEIAEEIDAAARGDVNAIVGSVLASHVGKLVRTALAFYIGDALVTLLVEMLVARRTGGAQPLPSAANGDVAETQRLRAEVVKDMKRVVRHLDRSLESSILCIRRQP